MFCFFSFPRRGTTSRYETQTIPAKKSKSEKTEKAPKEKKDKPASATPAAAASGEEGRFTTSLARGDA